MPTTCPVTSLSLISSALSYFLLLISFLFSFFFFFFNDTATTEIYTLSLHDALPICDRRADPPRTARHRSPRTARCCRGRSEEHTSELQSQFHLVCRLLLEKKKKKKKRNTEKKKTKDDKYNVDL